MLTNFFKLNSPFTFFEESGRLSEYFLTSSTLENVIFKPIHIDDQQKSLFKEKNFKNVSFSKTTFRGMTFTNCIFEDCLFIGSRFYEVQFHRCKFINCNLYKVSLEKCYLDPRSFEFDKKYRKTHANVMTELFHTLLTNAKSELQHTSRRGCRNILSQDG